MMKLRRGGDTRAEAHRVEKAGAGLRRHTRTRATRFRMRRRACGDAGPMAENRDAAGRRTRATEMRRGRTGATTQARTRLEVVVGGGWLKSARSQGTDGADWGARAGRKSASDKCSVEK